jgi:hypothetical protein
MPVGEPLLFSDNTDPKQPVASALAEQIVLDWGTKMSRNFTQSEGPATLEKQTDPPPPP